MFTLDERLRGLPATREQVVALHQSVNLPHLAIPGRKAGQARAKTTDANSFIYTSKANQLYRLTDDEVKGIKAKILFVPASSDGIFPPELSQRAAARFKAQGGTAEVAIIDGDGGHLDGVFNVAKQGEAIRAFLAK